MAKHQAEMHSTDFPVAQEDPIDLDADLRQRTPERIVAPDKPLEKGYLKALEFMEEPVTISIHEGSDPDAAPVADFCAVNGKKAEMLINGRWCETGGYLPLGVPITLKRKYVEALARPKITRYVTKIIERQNQDPINRLQRSTRVVCPIQIVRDPNPKGAEWFQRLVAVNY